MTSTMATVPGGAACYFCLGEEADEEGKPLVRDCSCRGGSAGFVHTSCLVKYAEQKSKAAKDGDLPSFREPWEICINCKQPFVHQLQLDLASAFVSFAEATYDRVGSNKWDRMKVMTALYVKIGAFWDKDVTETTMLVNDLLSKISQAKKALKMNSWVHLPKTSDNYRYYKAMCGVCESEAYKQLAGIALQNPSNEESSQLAIKHFKKARAIYNLFDMKDEARKMDFVIQKRIDDKQAVSNGDTPSSTRTYSDTDLEFARNQYESNLNEHGIESIDTIKRGVIYAAMLTSVNHCIEAEHLITKLTTISRRVHGPEHSIAVEADKLLKVCKERRVAVLPHGDSFQALRYENDGEICVVKGPITKPRQIDDEMLHRIANNLMIPKLGCAVICHGLVSASHLNGELGEVRDMKRSGTGVRLAVHFEKKGVKSALVKPENLRIAFELPDEAV